MRHLAIAMNIFMVNPTLVKVERVTNVLDSAGSEMTVFCDQTGS